MFLRRFYYDKLAQASYVLGCQATGDAIVIDPHRDSDVYIRAAAERGLRIRFVSETHIHADYLSGSRQLAARTGAELLLSGEGGEDWQYGFAERDGATIVRGGDSVEIGKVGIDVLHTPGHTPEHVSFLVTDRAASDQPLALLTGDFLFVGDVGRPDLLEKAAGVADTMEASARTLYRSLQRLSELPDHLQILPGHGAGSACGKALGAVPTSTLGYERLVNWGLQCETEDEFTQRVLEDQPEAPTYFAVMKRMNRDGPAILEELPSPERAAPGKLVSIMDQGGLVVDVRDPSDYALGHVPGTVNIPLSNGFPGLAGWILPYDRPVYVLAGSEPEASEVARDLAFIGLDDVRAYFDEEALAEWRDTRGPLAEMVSVDWEDAERLVEEQEALLLDVRERSEWKAGHAPWARHVHLGALRDRLDEIPRDRPVLLYCGIGIRSAVAASLLRSLGVSDARSVTGGLQERRSRGLAVLAA